MAKQHHSVTHPATFVETATSTTSPIVRGGLVTHKQTAIDRLPKVAQPSQLPPPVKETAADFSRREIQEVLERLQVVSNRLSSAKKRLQGHFGVPLTDSETADHLDPLPPGMDGIQKELEGLDRRLSSIADGMEELI